MVGKSIAAAILVLLAPSALAAISPLAWGGGGLEEPIGDDITPVERALADAAVQRFKLSAPIRRDAPASGPVSYPFFPHAGTLGDDLFLNNYVDLDDTSGLRDFECTNATYDGHQGHDSAIRTFGYQDAGIPIFAALDGTVVEVHDGEFDKQTSFNTSAVGNHVILSHGNSHNTWYWHMKKGSVSVALNQVVKAGTQLGLTGSSGYSNGPHLHFESRYNGQSYEPSAGACRAGASNWVHQLPIDWTSYLSEMVATSADVTNVSKIPYDMPRANNFTTGTARKGSLWVILNNAPANFQWRLRFLRPDATVAYDSGTRTMSNARYRFSYWYWVYTLDMPVAGVWRAELTVNGKVLGTAPLQVYASASQFVNHAPAAVVAVLDPRLPAGADAVFCRVKGPLLNADQDNDIVRFRYLWTANGATVRDVTTAARSDALTARATGTLLKCTVTPTDGALQAASISSQAIVGTTGDLNGDGVFDRSDAFTALRIAAGIYPSIPSQIAAGNVAGDARLSLLDAAALIRYALGF